MCCRVYGLKQLTTSPGETLACLLWALGGGCQFGLVQRAPCQPSSVILFLQLERHLENKTPVPGLSFAGWGSMLVLLMLHLFVITFVCVLKE